MDEGFKRGDKSQGSEIAYLLAKMPKGLASIATEKFSVYTPPR
jgi:hypothetical protein